MLIGLLIMEGGDEGRDDVSVGMASGHEGASLGRRV